MSSFRKSCLPSVCCAGAEVEVVDEVVVDDEPTVEIMRGLLWTLFASRPHVEPVRDGGRARRGGADGLRCRDTFAIGGRREGRRAVTRELTSGVLEPELHADVRGHEPLLDERFAEPR